MDTVGCFTLRSGEGACLGACVRAKTINTVVTVTKTTRKRWLDDLTKEKRPSLPTALLTCIAITHVNRT